jgi:uncharacterized membrane protein
MDKVAVVRGLHVTAAVLLLGNVVVTGFWAAFLYRVRSTVPFRPVARAILWADVLFTLFGGTLLTVSGILLVMWQGYQVSDSPWIQKGIGALGLSTLAWLVVLLPDQWRLERLGAADDARLRRTFLRWSIVGWASTALLFYGLWAMVNRR